MRIFVQYFSPNQLHSYIIIDWQDDGWVDIRWPGVEMQAKTDCFVPIPR